MKSVYLFVFLALLAFNAAAAEKSPTEKETVDLEQLAKTRSDWPEKVKLLKEVEISLIVDGKEIGKVGVEQNTEVKVLTIEKDRVQVGTKSGKGWVVVESTDLVARVLDMQRSRWVVDGETYRNVRVTNVTPATITIAYRGGAATLKIEKLSPDLQKQFNYDPDNAKQWLAEQAELEKQRAESEARERQRRTDEERNRKELEAKVKSAKQFVGRVIQVVDDKSLLVNSVVDSYYYNVNDPSLYLLEHGKTRLLVGYEFAAVDDDIVECHAYRDGTVTYKSVIGAEKTVERWVYCREAPPAKPVTPAPPTRKTLRLEGTKPLP